MIVVLEDKPFVYKKKFCMYINDFFLKIFHFFVDFSNKNFGKK